MTEVRRNILKTVCFYLATIAIIAAASISAPSGPCAPGGILLIFLVPFISTGMVLYNFLLIAKGDKSNRYSLTIHLLILLIASVFFFYGI
ncbi:MAG TPA: hypothetical protein VF691_23185 [Cytophagaceae bacterium]|jgi:uncharacterized membrane protein